MRPDGRIPTRGNVANPEFVEVVAQNATFALDFDGNNNIIYLGKAPMGTAKSANKWQIRYFSYDAGNNVTGITWANGNDQYVNVWNDRAGLPYS